MTSFARLYGCSGSGESEVRGHLGNKATIIYLVVCPLRLMLRHSRHRICSCFVVGGWRPGVQNGMSLEVKELASDFERVDSK